MTKLKEAVKQKNSKLAIEIIQGKILSAWLEYTQYRYKVWRKTPSTFAWLTNTWKTWPIAYDYLAYQLCGDEPGGGWDCLRLAIVNGMQDVVEEIYNQRVWPFPHNRPWSIGCSIMVPDTGLDVAICCRNLEMVKLFIERQKDYYHTFSSLSPMQLAVLPNFDLNIVKYLLKNGGDANETSDIKMALSHEPTRLQLRPSSKGTIYDIEINDEYQKLLDAYIMEGETNGTLISINDGVKNATVLFYAIRYNPDNHETVELINLLLDHGADINRITEFDGKKYNALQYAEYLGKHKIVKAILTHKSEKIATFTESPQNKRVCLHTL